jgi:NarL family two-component system response regulator LiaR
MISIALIDDHAVVRDGLRALLELQEDMRVCGEAGDARSGLEMVTREQPDVAVVDLVLPDEDGVRLASAIRNSSPATRVVILTSRSDSAPLAAALEAGVLGYQLKEIAGEELVQILRRTAAGEAQIHSRLLGETLLRLRHGETPAPSLSQREREVLLLIAEGLSNQAIGERLGIGEATVKTHVGNLLAKLGLADRTQLAVHAWRSGWVSGGRSP